MMKKRLGIAVGAIGLLVVITGGGLFVAYRATQHVPAAYRAALEADSDAAAEGSDAMLEKTTALASNLERPGAWSARFTAEEINGWLAVDLPRNHPDALPADLRDPRVAIQPGDLTVFCQYDDDGFQTVLSLTVDAYVSEPNVIAVEIRKARAGALPLPLGKVLDRVTQAAQRWDFRVRWRQAGGNPVALLTIPPAEDTEGKQVQLNDLRLAEGELYLAGSTEDSSSARDASQAGSH